MSGRSALIREPHSSTSRTQSRTEARYNVTIDYPRYDLHVAAASGNLGLVEYALRNGQPINSVLDGVLPLHAACAGGSEVVVKYLIDHGADVNAPRLPRRKTNEKHKSTGLAIGASGSTPLHFAAANGHMAVVRLLLSCGAAPDKTDKHGVTPEMLARENGWVDCADAIAAWSGGREGDLPPLQNGESAGTSSGNLDRERDGIEDAVGSRRLHVKRSIDCALHKFRAPLTLHHHVSHGQLRERDRTPPSPSSATHNHSFLSSHFHHSHSHSGSPSHSHFPHSLLHHGQSHSQSHSPAQIPMTVKTKRSVSTGTAQLSPKATGDQSFVEMASPTADMNFAQQMQAIQQQGRRPSLPQIFDDRLVPKRSSSRKRRPRSAGTDTTQGGGGGARSTANGDGLSVTQMINSSEVSASSSTTSTNLPPNASVPCATRKLSSKISLRNLFRRANNDASLNGSEPNSGAGSCSTSFSGSSAPVYNHNLNFVRGSSSPTPPASPLSSSFAPSPAPVQGSWYKSRFGNDSSGSMVISRNPNIPSAVELHHRYSDEELQFDEQEINVPNTAQSASSTRPSILRGHTRSSSSQSATSVSNANGTLNGQAATSRILRFDNDHESNPPSAPSNASFSAGRLRASRSASSLRHGETYQFVEEEGDEDYGESLGHQHESAPPHISTYEDAELRAANRESAETTRAASFSVDGKNGRARNSSFASTATSSSPGVTPDEGKTPYATKDFPFSIEHSPLTPLSATSEATQQTPTEDGQDDVDGSVRFNNEAPIVRSTQSVESRLRGESFSSVETDGSGASRPEPRSHASSEFTNITTPSPGVVPRRTSMLGGLSGDVQINTSESYLTRSPSIYTSEVETPDDSHHDPHSRPDCSLDLRSVSNLAEAEDLVRRAQQAILVSASAPATGPESPGASLSEQLAAYGQILALERRFARGEKQRSKWESKVTNDSDDEEKARREACPAETRIARVPQSTKEARAALWQKKRTNRGMTVGTASPTTAVAAAAQRRGVVKTPKHRRPHTAEGATQSSSSWNVENRTASYSRNGSNEGADTPLTPPISRSHTRSTSTPLKITITHNDEMVGNPDIRIIETDATPVESPSPLGGNSELELTPQPSFGEYHPEEELCHTPPISSPDLSSRYTFDNARPSTLPSRSHTPDPESPQLGFRNDDPYSSFNVDINHRSRGRGEIPSPSTSFGVPLTRVATAPLQDSHTGHVHGWLKPTSAKKLVKMGFPLDSANGLVSGSGSGVTSPAGGTGSRDHSKARFGGIKSLVRGLKNKA